MTRIAPFIALALLGSACTSSDPCAACPASQPTCVILDGGARTCGCDPSNPQCGGQICDVATEQCRSCTSANDCRDSSAGAFCRADGTCGACQADADCGDGLHCEEGVCGVACNAAGSLGTCDDALVNYEVDGGRALFGCKLRGGDGEVASLFATCDSELSMVATCAPDCTADADCAAGQRCHTGDCGCTTSADCHGDSICSHGVCAPCSLDSECPCGQLCGLDSVCHAPCTADSDCMAYDSAPYAKRGLDKCSPGGRCVDCAQDQDCPTGERCYVNGCDTVCDAASNCPLGCTASGRCTGCEQFGLGPLPAAPISCP